MVMTITRPQIEAIIAEDRAANAELGMMDICETNSRNRRVRLALYMDLDEGDRFQVYDAGQMVAEMLDIDVAVMVFNYYGSRNLEPR